MDKRRLNDAQIEAVKSEDRFTLIIACAGAGKTQTLMSKLAYLVNKGVDPSKILLLTFTNKAADEMKDRAAKVGGEKCKDVTACTYHSFCALMLRKYGSAVGLNTGFKILDTFDCKDIITFIKNGNKGYKGLPPSSKILGMYSSSINTEVSFEVLMEKEGLDPQEKVLVRELINDYVAYKKEHNMVDFDDLMVKFHEALQNPQIQKDISEKYEYIMVDEFQDTNNLQNRIVDSMLGEKTKLTVVGDDYQSIYAFRGAQIENFLKFQERHSPCKVIVLDVNYRSTQEILDVANKVMNDARAVYYDGGYEKNMRSDKSGNEPKILNPDNSHEQAETAMDMIRSLLDSGENPSEIAVLFRSSKSSGLLEMKLTKEGIPYNKYGGVKFFELAPVRDILAFQKLSINTHDETQWFRILDLIPGIGGTYGTRIASACSDKDFLLKSEFEGKKTATAQRILPGLYELNDAIEKIIAVTDPSEQLDWIWKYYHHILDKRIAYEEEKINSGKVIKEETLEKYKNLKREAKECVELLKEMIKGYSSINAWLNDTTLDAKRRSDPDKSIVLSTIHSAKGLEWDNVFILDVVDGIFPSMKVLTSYYMGNPEDLKEELRCFYVALTRPRKNLVIFSPSSVTVNGQWSAGRSVLLNPEG